MGFRTGIKTIGLHCASVFGLLIVMMEDSCFVGHREAGSIPELLHDRGGFFIFIFISALVL
jgi:hypothetical protein